MRNVVFIFLVFTGSLFCAQTQYGYGTMPPPPGGPGTGSGDGDLEGNDLPINNYIPLLVLTAVGFIVYYRGKEHLGLRRFATKK